MYMDKSSEWAIVSCIRDDSCHFEAGKEFYFRSDCPVFQKGGLVLPCCIEYHLA